MHVDGWAGEQKGRRSVSSYLTEEALLAEQPADRRPSRQVGEVRLVLTFYTPHAGMHKTGAQAPCESGQGTVRTLLACKLSKCSREIGRDTIKVPERAQWLQGRGVVSSLCTGSAGSIPNLQCAQIKLQSALIEPFGRPAKIS